MINVGKIVVCCQGLVGGRKKRIIRHFGPLGFQPRTKVSEQECSTTKLDHSSLPTEKCHFFASDFTHNNSPHRTQNEPSCALL